MLQEAKNGHKTLITAKLVEDENPKIKSTQSKQNMTIQKIL